MSSPSRERTMSSPQRNQRGRYRCRLMHLGCTLDADAHSCNQQLVSHLNSSQWPIQSTFPFGSSIQQLSERASMSQRSRVNFSMTQVRLKDGCHKDP
eukprot:126276-Amphidinium_carterae.1